MYKRRRLLVRVIQNVAYNCYGWGPTSCYFSNPIHYVIEREMKVGSRRSPLRAIQSSQYSMPAAHVPRHYERSKDAGTGCGRPWRIPMSYIQYGNMRMRGKKNLASAPTRISAWTVPQVNAFISSFTATSIRHITRWACWNCVFENIKNSERQNKLN